MLFKVGLWVELEQESACGLSEMTCSPESIIPKCVGVILRQIPKYLLDLDLQKEFVQSEKL